MKRTLLRSVFQKAQHTALALFLLGAGTADAQCNLNLSLTGTGACLGSDTLHLAGATGVTQIVWQNAGTTVFTSVGGSATRGVTVAGDSAGAGDVTPDRLFAPYSVAVDAAGNVYVSDKGNNRVQKWAPGASSGITVAGSPVGNSGIDDSLLNSPADIYIDAVGNLYIADQFNQRIQKWAPGATSGVTVAGSAVGTSGVDDSLLNNPQGVFVDGSGNVYVADQANHRVQKWAPGATSGITVAGDPLGSSGLAGNLLYQPGSVYVDGSGNVFIGDAGNNRVQRWAPGASRGYTVAGDSLGTNTIYGNSLYTPIDAILDANGNLIVADASNNRIQKWVLGAARGYTVAGDSMTINTSGASGLNFPTGVAVHSGAIYIADFNNNRVQKWGGSPTSSYVPTTAGSYVAIVTTAGGCVDTSNAIVVGAPVTPSVSITATATTLCSGAVDTFTAAPTNGGAAPTYQWYVNGASVATGSRYITSSLNNNDSVYVVLTSNADCASPSSASSNNINITVNGTVVPTVSASVSDSHICIGSVDSFTVTSTNGGANPTYQWYLNGSPVATGTIYSTSALSSNDSVWVVLTSNARCASPAAVNSSKLNVTVDTVPHIVLPQSILSGNGVVTLHAPSGFYSYQWLQRNGGLVTSIPNANQDTFLTTTWGFYSVVVTTVGGCVDTSTEVDVFITGINELSTYHVNVYPNPTDNFIYVSAENLIGEHAIEITDNVGRTVYSRPVEGTTIHEAIDMSTLSSGIYMVMLRDAAGVIAVRKVVKN